MTVVVTLAQPLLDSRGSVSALIVYSAETESAPKQNRRRNRAATVRERFPTQSVKDLFKVGLVLSILEGLLLILMVAIYWPMIGVGLKL